MAGEREEGARVLISRREREREGPKREEEGLRSGEKKEIKSREKIG